MQNLVYDYEDLVFGIVKNYPPSKAKKLRDVNQREFLTSPDLVKKYGFWSDTDKDIYPNFSDSFPFDPKRHGILSTIRRVADKISDTIRKPFSSVGTSIATGGASSSPTGGGILSGGSTTSSGSGSFGGSQGTGFTSTGGGINVSSGGGSSGGGGGSSGGGGSVTTTQPGVSVVITDKTKQTGTTTPPQKTGQGGLTPQQQAFSGKVEEFGAYQDITRDRPSRTEYFVEGQKVGRTYESGDRQTFAETEQPSEITFEREGKKEVVRFTKEGATQQVTEIEPSTYDFFGGRPVYQQKPAGTTLTQDIKEVFGTILIPFKDTANLFFKNTGIDESIGDFGTKTIDIISKGEQKTREIIFPSKKEERLKQEEENKQIESLNKDIETYNALYGSKELSEQKYKEAKQIETQLGNRINYFKQREAEKERLEQQRRYEVSAAPLDFFFMSFAKGVVESPFMLGKFGVGLVTQPVKTTTELVQGYIELPKQFLENPVEVSGEFLGSIAGQSLILGGAGILIKGAGRLIKGEPAIVKNTRRSLSKVKEGSIKHSFSVDDAVKIGTNTDGSIIWEVKGKIKTLVKDPKGKVINTIQTTTFSDVVTSQTKEGAIKTYADTYAYSLGKYGVRTYLDKPKVTFKAQVHKAEGEFTFRPADNPELLLGRGETQLRHFGTMKGRVLDGEISGKIVKKQAQPESSGLSEIVSKRISEGLPSKRKIEGMEVSGTEDVSFNLFRTDVTKEKLGVKSYRKAPPFSFNKLIKTLEAKKPYVKPYVRRYPKEQLAKRSLGAGFSKVFTPEELIFNLKGMEFEELGLKARLPKTKPQVTQPYSWLAPEIKIEKLPPKKAPEIKLEIKTGDNALNLILGKEELKEIAKATAEAQSRALIKEVDIPKPRARLRSPTSELGKVWSGISPKLSPLLAQLPRQEEKTKTQQKFNLGQESMLSLLNSSALEVLTKEERQAQRERLAEELQLDVLIKERQAERERLAEELQLKVATKERQAQRERLAELQIQKQLQLQSPGANLISPAFVELSRRVTPETPTIRTFFFYLPKGKEDKKLKEKPYDAYAYIDATKTNKARYEKLNEEPLTLMGALDQMSEFVDRNITRRGKVTLTPPKIQKGKKVYPVVEKNAGETGYFEIYNQKFRPYRVQRGQKKPLNPGTYIEKESFSLDRPGEVRTIQKEKRRVESIRNFFGI